MEKNMKDIFAIIQENKALLRTRETLLDILKPVVKDISVQIGGSYALKFWCEAFADREISDYDFIVKTSIVDAHRVIDFLDKLCKLGCISKPCTYYDYPSYYMGYVYGKRVNVIVVGTESPFTSSSHYESMKDVIDVKKAWVRREEQSHRQPRAKDLKDIEIYEKWINDNNLPF